MLGLGNYGNFANYSTETALVRLYNDMIHFVDRGEMGALALLDAAFYTVDHRFMADVLHRLFDVRGDALAWFVYCFDERTHVATVGHDTSLTSLLSTGVPQGSALGPRPYVIYAEDAQEMF